MLSTAKHLGSYASDERRSSVIASESPSGNLVGSRGAPLNRRGMLDADHPGEIATPHPSC